MASNTEGFEVYKVISICVLAIFSFLFSFAVFIAVTRGIGRHGGWAYLILVCVGRIISSALNLGLTEMRNSWYRKDYEEFDSRKHSLDSLKWEKISYVGMAFSAVADVFVVLTMLEVVHKVTLNWSRSLKAILPILHALQWLSLALRLTHLFTVHPELYLTSWAINAFTFVVLSLITIFFRCNPASRHLDQAHTRIHNYLLFSIPFFGAHFGYALFVATNDWMYNNDGYLAQMLGQAIAFYAMQAIAVLLWCIAALGVRKWNEKSGDGVLYHRHATESDDVVVC